MGVSDGFVRDKGENVGGGRVKGQIAKRCGRGLG